MQVDKLKELQAKEEKRVLERIPDDSPLKEDDELHCPYCRRVLSARQSTMGRLGDGSETLAYIDGVMMKCAGDEGCASTNWFDIPITEEEYLDCREERGGTDNLDFAFSADETDEVRERLDALGYINFD